MRVTKLSQFCSSTHNDWYIHVRNDDFSPEFIINDLNHLARFEGGSRCSKMITLDGKEIKERDRTYVPKMFVWIPDRNSSINFQIIV